MGGSDGKLYVYDIGDMALPRESEWTDLQRTLAQIQGGGPQMNMLQDGEAAARARTTSSTGVNGRA